MGDLITGDWVLQAEGERRPDSELLDAENDDGWVADACRIDSCRFLSMRTSAVSGSLPEIFAWQERGGKAEKFMGRAGYMGRAGRRGAGVAGEGGEGGGVRAVRAAG